MENEVTSYSNRIGDVILRVQAFQKNPNLENSASPTVEISYLSQTSSFAASLVENVILKDIVRNLWYAHLYNQEYISFLLGSYSKEEFKKIAKEHAQPFQKEIDERYVYFGSLTAFNVLNQSLTSSDLSLLLNIDAGAIENKMAQIGFNKLEDSKDE